MAQEGVSLSGIDALENGAHAIATHHLSDLLQYFRYVQETLLIAFHNAGNSIPVPNTPNNPKLLAFIAAARAFSIARTAIDQTLRGYPLEGIALTRILAELAQSSQYLVRHPDLIDSFVSGRVKLERILKLARLERGRRRKDFFGPFWSLMSRYAYASPDLLALPLKAHANRMTVRLVISDPGRIEDAPYGIMTALLTQYRVFRAGFLRDLAVATDLNARDKLIFRPDNIRKFARFGSLSDALLDRLYRLATRDEGAV